MCDLESLGLTYQSLSKVVCNCFCRQSNSFFQMPKGFGNTDFLCTHVHVVINDNHVNYN